MLSTYFCAAVGVLEQRVAAVDDDVAGFEVRDELLDEFVHRLAGLDQHHHAAGRLELGNHFLDPRDFLRFVAEVVALRRLQAEDVSGSVRILRPSTIKVGSPFEDVESLLDLLVPVLAHGLARLEQDQAPVEFRAAHEILHAPVAAAKRAIALVNSLHPSVS